MKTAIFYFSGTGNTEYIARYIHEKLISSEIFNIEMVQEFDYSQYEEFIIGFPVYACDIPIIMKSFLKQFPNEKKKLYLFATKGIYSGNALQNAYKILKKKGYILFGKISLVMPGSDGLAMMKKDSKMLKKMINKDFHHIKKLDNWINEKVKTGQTKEIMWFNPLNYLVYYLMKGFYRIFENKIKHKYHVDDSCVHCHLCEKNCPVSNITVTNLSVEFGDHCLLCMRCIHQCPNEAIQIGKITRGKYRYKGPNNDFKVYKK